MRSEPGTRPRVTAIMIFLNGEQFLAEAIDSVLGQTLTDWELILVDDGSTDGATAIAQSYARRFSDKICYTEHPGHENRGMSASRNRGIALARGDTIAFLDADDIWLPRRLAAHMTVLDAHPEVGLVMGPTLWWRSWAAKGGNARVAWQHIDVPREQGLPTHQVIDAPAVAISFLESHGTALCGICSLTARRDEVLAAGGFNDEFRTLYEDQVFEFRMCLRSKVWVVDEILDQYRQHPDSACNMEGRRSGDARMRPIFLAWLQGHLVESGCKDERLWRAFCAEMYRLERPRSLTWRELPKRAKSWWNVNGRRTMMFVLTPRLYNRLRYTFGLSYVDPGSVR